MMASARNHLNGQKILARPTRNKRLDLGVLSPAVRPCRRTQNRLTRRSFSANLATLPGMSPSGADPD